MSITYHSGWSEIGPTALDAPIPSFELPRGLAPSTELHPLKYHHMLEGMLNVQSQQLQHVGTYERHRRGSQTHNLNVFHRRWILLQLLAAFGTVCSYGTKTIRMGNDAFSIRPYSSVTDDQNLREMCKDVWGGTDYLPETASSYENDPACQFLVLEDQASGSLAAAGNLRAIDPSKGISYWIEAIRVSPSFEGRGVGTGLVRELCKRARDKGALEILSSTIDANRAMQAIFGKPEIDLVPVSGFRCPNWDKLENLHGWNTSDEKEPQNLLEALGAKDLSSNDAKFSRTWDVIETYAELRAVLKRMNRSGSTIGHLPSIANPVFVSDDLRDSLRRGLVRKLRNADEPDDDSKPCVFGIFRDRSMSPGLKSQYVCSIVAMSREDFEAAVWEACQPKYLPLLGGVPFGLFTFEQPHPPVPFEADSIQGMLRSVCTDMVFIYYQWVAEGDS